MGPADYIIWTKMVLFRFPSTIPAPRYDVSPATVQFVAEHHQSTVSSIPTAVSQADFLPEAEDFSIIYLPSPNTRFPWCGGYLNHLIHFLFQTWYLLFQILLFLSEYRLLFRQHRLDWIWKLERRVATSRNRQGISFKVLLGRNWWNPSNRDQRWHPKTKPDSRSEGEDISYGSQKMWENYVKKLYFYYYHIFFIMFYRLLMFCIHVYSSY